MKTSFVIRRCVLALLILVLAGFAGSAFAAIFVRNEAELNDLSDTDVAQNVTLAPRTFDMSAYTEWTPIKSLAQGCTFNGNGAVISGLAMGANTVNVTIDGYAYKYAGLIAENNGTVKDLSMNISEDVSVEAYLGCIVGCNKATGSVQNCTVYSDNSSKIIPSSNTGKLYEYGGIVSHNYGTVSGCTVRGLSFRPAGVYNNIGGIAAGLYGSGLVNECCVYDTVIDDTGASTARVNESYSFIVAYMFRGGTLNACSAENSVLKVRGGYVGGIVATAFDYENGSPITISNCRVKNCDFIRNCPNGDSYSSGGLFGWVMSYGHLNIHDCYIAGKKDVGINNIAGDMGGILGIPDKRVGNSGDWSDFGLNRCYYETDNAQGITGIFETNNYFAQYFTTCEGVTTSNIQSGNFPADYLNEGWRAVANDYPVYGQAEAKQLVISRPQKDGVYLSRSIFKVMVGDIDEGGEVSGDAVIPYSDLRLVDVIGDGTDITVDNFTVDGVNIPANTALNVADYGDPVNISAKVTNNTAAALQTEVEYYRALYNRGRRMYTAESLAMLNTVLNAAEDALSTDFINITKTEADGYLQGMNSAALNKLICDVTFLAGNGKVTRNGIRVSGIRAEKNTTINVTAVPNSGYDFVYWMDEYGNILGQDAELEYSVFSTTAITAVFRASGKTFTYQDNYGKVYKIQQVSDFSELAYPAAVGSKGLRSGFMVESWSNDYGADLPASGAVDKDVTFTAKLVRAASDKFTVKYKDNPDAEWQEQRVNLGYLFEKEAADSYGGAAFSCWKDGNGDIVSYDKKVSVAVYSNLELTPYFEGAMASATIALLQDPISYSDAGKISFTGQILEGDDFGSEVYHGVLLVKSDSPVEVTFDTPGVIVGKSSGYSAQTHTYIINKKNVSAGDTWYGRAFIVYYDADNEMQIAYSETKSATL